jgi:hypothetical protein
MASAPPSPDTQNDNRKTHSRRPVYSPFVTRIYVLVVVTEVVVIAALWLFGRAFS